MSLVCKTALLSFLFNTSIVDLDFIRSVAYYKINVQDQMRKLFCEPCHLYVTSCFVRELRKLPKQEQDELYNISKTMDVHYCQHPDNYTLSQCLVDLTSLLMSQVYLSLSSL